MPGCQLCGGEHAVGPEACPDKRIGEVIAGKYVIEALLGCGGICAVYAAHHRILRRVVIRRPAENFDTDAPFLQRLAAMLHDVPQELLTLFAFTEGLAR